MPEEPIRPPPQQAPPESNSTDRVEVTGYINPYARGTWGHAPASTPSGYVNAWASWYGSPRPQSDAFGRTPDLDTTGVHSVAYAARNAAEITRYVQQEYVSTPSETPNPYEGIVSEEVDDIDDDDDDADNDDTTEAVDPFASINAEPYNPNVRIRPLTDRGFMNETQLSILSEAIIQYDDHDCPTAIYGYRLYEAYETLMQAREAWLSRNISFFQGRKLSDYRWLFRNVPETDLSSVTRTCFGDSFDWKTDELPIGAPGLYWYQFCHAFTQCMPYTIESPGVNTVARERNPRVEMARHG